MKPRPTVRSRRLSAGPLAVVAAAMIAGMLFFLLGGTARGSTKGSTSASSTAASTASTSSTTSTTTSSASSSTQSGSPQVSSDPAVITAGEQLFNEHCESCHGYEGKGGENGAPALVSVGAAAADFYLSTGRMPLNNPGNQAIAHPPYFTSSQIEELDSYIADLPNIVGTGVYGPGIPTVEPTCPTNTPQAGCVTLSEGEALYSMNCAECHQADGAGNMLSKGNVIPSLHNATLTQIAEAARVGPKPMPTFGTDELDQAQLSAVAQYVKSLQQTNGPGGFGLGGMGPVVEGFVGVTAGFGLILLAARWIGNRG